MIKEYRSAYISNATKRELLDNYYKKVKNNADSEKILNRMVEVMENNHQSFIRIPKRFVRIGLYDLYFNFEIKYFDAKDFDGNTIYMKCYEFYKCSKGEPLCNFC